MYYKGQTIVLSYVDEGEDDIKEMPGIFLGINQDKEILCYHGRKQDDIIEMEAVDMRAIGDPSIDGGVYWGKFRTRSFTGVMSEASVIKHYKDWNKELTNTKRMLTNRNKKKNK